MVDLALARKVLETEAAAILALVPRIGRRFEQAVEMLQACEGRVILTGMGKSGIICRKVAATLTSTGTAALFLHPAEAMHGDLGVIQGKDVVIAISSSGETAEVIRLIETIRRVGAALITIVGATKSTLGEAADITIDCSV
ncbi:MAG: SIS domain-containing protein, partial [Vicinamibacterales bacterium]